MEWFTIILIIISIILFIILIGVIIFVNTGSGLNQKCNGENSCKSGLVCSWLDDFVCKAGLESSCQSTNDCFDGLVCYNGKCGKPISKTNISKSVPPVYRPNPIKLGSTPKELPEPVININNNINNVKNDIPVDRIIPPEKPKDMPKAIINNQPDMKVNVPRDIINNVNNMINVPSQSETDQTSANTGCSNHIEIGSNETAPSVASTPFYPIENKGYLSRD